MSQAGIERSSAFGVLLISRQLYRRLLFALNGANQFVNGLTQQPGDLNV